MNKAFVKEADDLGNKCPRCASLGVAVGFETLTAFILPEWIDSVSKPAFFCDFPRCEVAYFDAFERFVTVAQLKKPVWPKDPAAPLCGCFQLMLDDVEADVREGGVTRVKGVVTRSQTAAARCLTESPTGQSCAAVVQRCYFRLRAEQSS